MSTIIEPFGRSFLYGLDALQRKRTSAACTHFVTALETFAQVYAGLVADRLGVASAKRPGHIRLQDLTRTLSQQLQCTLPIPERQVRHDALHQGRIPTPAEAQHLADEVISSIDVWLKAIEALAGPDLERLSAAYWHPIPDQGLPQDVAEFDRRVFDLRISWHTMQGAGFRR